MRTSLARAAHLTVTVNLKNNETGTVNVNGKDRTIVLTDHRCGRHSGQGCFQRDRRTRYDRKRRQQRCRLCHPAGREGFPVGLLPDEVDSIEDYLQDTA